MFLRAEKSPIRGGRTAFLSRGKPPVAVKFSSIKGRELLCNVRFVFKKKEEKKEKQGEKVNACLSTRVLYAKIKRVSDALLPAPPAYVFAVAKISFELSHDSTVTIRSLKKNRFSIGAHGDPREIVIVAAKKPVMAQ